MKIYIFEDRLSHNFLPLTYTRPVFDLKVGIRSILENILDYFRREQVSLIVRPYLAELTALKHPQFSVNPIDIEEGLWINGRMYFSDTEIRNAISSPSQPFYADNQLAIVYLEARDAKNWMDNGGPVVADLEIKSQPQKISPQVFNYPWDIISKLIDFIIRDFNHLYGKGEISGKVYQNVTKVNEQRIVVADNVIIKPGVVLDAEEGPIVIDKGVEVMPNAYIEGPTYIGKKSKIKAGAMIYGGTFIGDVCKVGGEVESSVIHGYTNKQHDGFLGHSYLGEWVNIGAGTITSDLKNTYSSIRVWVNGKLVDSGLLFVGLTMGDHTKTGINTMFNTGTVVGVACNIFGSGLQLKYIPSFSWGGASGFEEHKLDKMVETAKSVMKRRNVELSEVDEKLLRYIFDMTRDERCYSKLNSV
jgi:UDP-N-acetylglucosamine diphosphorylase/glucosamine-1-phosphate N-acetyltransferase